MRIIKKKKKVDKGPRSQNCFWCKNTQHRTTSTWPHLHIIYLFMRAFPF